jgi:hypothetical protein
LDKKSPYVSTDGIAERVAEFMAEALNMDVSDVERRYNVRDYVESAITNHNSHASMARDILNIDANDKNIELKNDKAYEEYLKQQEEQEALLGVDYNQDIADEVWDAAFNQMTEDDWNALEEMRIMDYLAEEESKKNPLVKEINSLPLTRIEGLGMGQSQVSGVYISTEAENRYQAQRPELPVLKVKVSIQNPYDAEDDFGLVDYRNRVLNDNKDEFNMFEYAEFEVPEGPVTVDDLNDEGIEKLANLTQERLKSEGYDSVYFRETKEQEGELVVFDKNNVETNPVTPPAPAAPETKPEGEGTKPAPKGPETKAEEETMPTAEFTSKQEGNASTEFDGIKKPSKIKTKSFDNKYGNGAFERMQNITQNFEDIMDNLSDKIKQDCI